MKKRQIGALMASFAFAATLMVGSGTANAVPATSGVQISIGDSFAAGTGAENSTRNVALPANLNAYGTTRDKCSRTANAYPVLLAANLGYSLVNATCAGATVDNVLSTGQFGEPAQIDRVTADANLVTIQIGGNDIGFVGALTCIVATGCSNTSPEIVQTNGLIALLPAKLDAVYSEVRLRAPNATIRTVGYPQIFPYKGSPGGGAGCPVFLSENEKKLANDLEAAVNGAIRSATASVSNAQFIDPYAAGSPFMTRDVVGQGTDACSLRFDKAMNGARIDYQAANFHPNSYAHKYYTTLLRGTL